MILTQSTTNEKLKETALYIISKCQDKKNFGLKVLHKLLYFSDFSFYKKNHTSITGEEYKRFVYGPFMPELSSALSALESDGSIISEREKFSKDKFQNRYKLVKNANITLLSPDEKKEIDLILDKIGNLNGNEIEKLSHKDVPWQVTEENDVIDYDLVFYRDEEISAKVE